MFYFQVLASKEAHAQGLKRRLGITAWREFSEDMTQGLKNLQDSQAYKKTGQTWLISSIKFPFKQVPDIFNPNQRFHGMFHIYKIDTCATFINQLKNPFPYIAINKQMVQK